LLSAVLGPLGVFALADPSAGAPQPGSPRGPAEAAPEQVHRLCSACHAYPPPETFPRSAWRLEVKQAYEFQHKEPGRHLDFPPIESVIRYYERRAPETLPPQTMAANAPGPSPVRFERRGIPLPDAAAAPGVSNVQLVRLSGAAQPDVLVCDAGGKQVLLLTPGPEPKWRVLAKGVCAARAVVTDLDGDGVPDIVLACLGSYQATDNLVGSVVWLKGSADGSYAPVTLLDGVGRVADVQVADFNGDGKPDLVVGAFGWRQAGEILWLENRTADWSKPVFVPHVVDQRHGTTDVKVTDLNGDGKPDVVALLTQEHETVVAFVNQGGGRFEAKTIWAAPHPAYGCNGIQLVDLDGDGDLDVLLTNGDTLDFPYLLKPYHGVQWLENRGAYPFTMHRLTDMYGAGAAVAADLNGDGKLDIVVTSFLPASFFPRLTEQQVDALVWLEQTAPGRFVRHSLEKGACDYPTCAVGAMEPGGKPSIVLGRFLNEPKRASEDAVVIWRSR
jgi:hypothetical protein